MKKLILILVCLLVVLSLAACNKVVEGPQGPQGERGPQGEQGLPGKDGTDGTDGVTPTIEISEDGFWIINGIKTEYVAVGNDGTNGTDGATPTVEIGTDGYWIINGIKTNHKAIGVDGASGSDGKDGADGEDGKDGVTPTIEISDDGCWIINGVKTEYKAIGVDGVNGSDGKDGADGIGIASTTMDENGNVVITYTDGTVEIIEHKWKYTYTLQDSSCIDTGIDLYSCADCSLVRMVTTERLSHSFVDGVCTGCGKKYFELCVREGDYIYLGQYPQTIKNDDVTITSTTDDRGYYLGSDGSYYASVTATSYGFTFSSGEAITNGEVYYFKVEPIRWRILSEDGEMAVILCDSVIENQRFDGESNNYAESEIRQWLNEMFYETAFNELQQEIILITTVDNSAASTASAANKNVCENTEDKVFLLSYSDVLNTDYGFASDSSKEDEARRIQTSDYVRAYISVSVGDMTYRNNGIWLLRTPEENFKSYVLNVADNGAVSLGSKVDTYSGVVPALSIDLSGVDEVDHIYVDGSCIICGAKKPSEGLEYTLSDDGTYYTVSGIGTCTDNEVVIPSVYKDLPVIGIGYRAFYNCDSLTSITIPDSVTTIGSGAFYYCRSLTSITIPDSVTTIGNSAFYHCDSLVSITIPDSVTTIGYGAFSCCGSLTNITVDENNQYYKSIDGNLYTKDGETFIQYAIGKKDTSFIIPDSVTTIGDDAFSFCVSLTNITIPDSVTTIGDDAFCGCDSLTSITIPDSVTTIGNSAFFSCDSLKSIIFEENSELTSISYSAFSSCVSLTNITIPDSVTTIGNSAFLLCDSLTSITIPDSVTTIGQGAFSNCNHLYVIYNYSSLTLEIGSSTNGYVACYAKILVDSEGTSYANDGYEYILTEDDFLFSHIYSAYKLIAYCGSEKTVTLPDDINGNEYSIHEMRGVVNVIIPGSITTIGDKAFSHCGSLTSITIPDSVTTIGNWAFYHCDSLVSITVDENNQYYKSIDSNLYTKDGKTLIQYAIGKKDTSFIIPNSVTTIGDEAFEDCDNLTSITIPDSITTIGSCAFSDCDSLTSITIPDSVITIGYFAFSSCDSLTSITIPDRVTTIGSRAFSYCDSLTSVYYGGNEEDWSEISIESSNSDLTDATLYYYSDVEPTEEGNFWHYDENGEIAVW